MVYHWLDVHANFAEDDIVCIFDLFDLLCWLSITSYIDTTTAGEESPSTSFITFLGAVKFLLFLNVLVLARLSTRLVQ